MRRSLLKALDLATWACLAIALFALLTGGIDETVLGLRLRATGIANPIAYAMIAAAMRRLLAPHQADGLVRARAALRRRTESLWGPRAERLRGWMHLRGGALVMALLAVWLVDRAAVGIIEVEGDGVGYYAYLRSALIDGDLDFLNEYRDHDPRQQWVDRRTPIDRVENPFSIGPAILWAPFFLVGWGAALAARGAGVDVALHGYSAPFTWAVASGTWLYGLLGCIVLYRLLLAEFGRRSATIATLGAVLASPLAYYLVYANFYSHALSFFAATVFLLTCLHTPAERPAWRWLLVGLAGALMALTRWQDATLWIVPAVHLGWSVVTAAAGARTAAFGRAVVRGLAFLVGALIGISPQLAVFQVLNGYWLGIPQGDGFVAAWPKWIVPTLFSSFHGLYFWSPLLLVATIALLWWAATTARRHPWSLAFAVGFASQLWANGAVSQWWAGHSFGARRFSSSVPLLAFGLAFALTALARRRRARTVLVVAIAVGCVTTHLFLHLWITGSVPHGEPPDLAVAASHLWDLVSRADLRELVGYHTVQSLVLYRLSDLLHQAPLLAFSGLLYALCRKREGATIQA